MNIRQQCPARETLSDLLDGALPLIQRRVTERHLHKCEMCALVFAEEQALQEAARGYQSTTGIPLILRANVLKGPFEKVPARQKPARSIPVFAALASVATVLVITVVLRPAVRGLPAYAAVEKSMAEIRTASWEEHETTYTPATKKTNWDTVRLDARMNPPALRQAYSWDSVTILNPANLTVEDYKGDGTGAYTVFTDKSGTGFFTIETAPKRTAADVVRSEILSKLMAPKKKAIGRLPWHEREVVLQGRTLWRFDFTTVFSHKSGSVDRALAEHDGGRLTTMGHRTTLWADPETCRVIRSEDEWYDGGRHSVTVGDHFVYDQPLSDALFKSNRE